MSLRVPGSIGAKQSVLSPFHKEPVLSEAEGGIKGGFCPSVILTLNAVKGKNLGVGL